MESKCPSETSDDFHRTALFYVPEDITFQRLMVLENGESKRILGFNGKYNEALIEISTVMTVKSSVQSCGL
jgi:hypothetical protein